MKKLTGALVLSFSLLLISGCRSAGETRDAEDASTPSSDSSSGQPIPEAIKAAKETLNKDAGSGSADADTGSGQGNTPEKPLTGGSTAAALSPAERQAQESCVDKWLTEKKLDRYGNAEGTMYAGGTPLFDERTGESRDRLDFVYERQPEARKACAGAAGQVPQKGTPPKAK
ncbi:MAG TPA: hypothetical protein VNA24_02150 [Hyalangium sp.]|nr:hypothetical protein [Hyalangium sp.]